MLLPGEAIVVFGGGTPTGFAMRTYTASTGSLSLNNSGDQITLRNPSGNVVDNHTYGAEGGDNQSLTRDPNIPGNFVKHSLAIGSAGALFSPGTKIDGSSFTLPLPPVPFNWKYIVLLFSVLAFSILKNRFF